MRMRITLAAFLGMFASAMVCAQSADLAGLAHVAFRVSDLEKTEDFYRKLGYERAFAFTDAGKTTQVFIKINDRQFVELYPRTQDSQPMGLTHVCFEATDIEAVRAAYVKQGLDPPEAKKARAGNLLFVIHDPEGQLLEYTQYLPGSLHSEDRGKHLGAERISDRLQGAALLARDVAAERAYYTGKLGFADDGSAEPRLRLPGNSGDELELQPVNTTDKAHITFMVESVKGAAKKLRKRGLDGRVRRGEVAVSDPDGNFIVFREAGNGRKQ